MGRTPALVISEQRLKNCESIHLARFSRAGSDGARACGAAEQADRGELGTRDHRENSPPLGDGEDGSRFPPRVSQDG